MKGIRKKISVGFTCLALMLMFSGLVSLFELRRLGSSTRDLLETSTQSMELSRKMLDAVQELNTSLLQTIVLERPEFDESFERGREEFESAISSASRTPADLFELDNIRLARDNYYSLVGKFFDDNENTDIEWFVGMYRTAYQELTDAIKDYMVTSQRSLLANAADLRSNTYRAMMSGVITLCIAILMSLIFAYLLDLYYTRPILGIDKGLKGYIAHKIPFRVKTEGRDEIASIKDNIETITNSRRE